jgi:voltage-gated potassium channel
MNKIIYLLIGAALVILTGIFMIYSIESGHPDSQINSIVDAVWWTVATVTTVGYGDVVPVTETGRIMAVAYMFFGITFVAISISVLGTSFYKKRFENEKEISHAQSLILDKLQDIEDNQKKIQKKLEDLAEKVNSNSKNISD